MGLLHNELRRGPLSNALKDALGVQASEAGLERFGETLTPVIDLWRNPEWASLRDEQLFSRAPTLIPAVALRFSLLALVNPVGSGVIGVIEMIAARSSTGNAFVSVERGDVRPVIANGLDFQGIPLDTRYPLLGECSRLLGRTGDTASGVALENYAVRSFSPIPFEGVNVVLSPGGELIIATDVVNTSLGVTLRWRERKAFPGEI